MATRIEDMDLVISQLPVNPTYEEFLIENARQREQTWLIKNSLGYGIVTYDDSVALLRDSRLHQASHLMVNVFLGENLFFKDYIDTVGLLHTEGSDHHRLRRLVAQPFSSKSIDTLRPFMKSYLQDIIDKLHLGSDEAFFEFQKAFKTFPIAVICYQIGISDKDWELFSYWSEILPLRWSMFIIGREQEFIDAMNEFTVYCKNLIEERRNNLGDDLLSRLITVEEEGDRLSTDELVSLIFGMIGAGVDIVSNQLGIVVSLLVEHSEILQTLNDNPSLIANTIEECLRNKNAIRTFARIVVEEFEYRDVIFSPGQILTFSSASANHDEDKYANSDEFDIYRDNASSHLSFSTGIHHCLGQYMARVELQEALSAFVRNWSSIEVDGSIEWRHLRMALWGAVSIPLHVVRNSSFIHH